MRVKRITAILLAALLLGAGCSARSADLSGELACPVTAKALEQPEYDEGSAAVANGVNRFAFQLAGRLAEELPDNNFVSSPYSVWLPLAALLNATGDEHREALLSALGATGASDAVVNRAASRMLYSLTKEERRVHDEAHTPLQIANAVFVDRQQTLKGDFAQIFMEYYRGQVMGVDFKSDDAVAAVNKWAGDNTQGRIPQIIEEFDPDTVAAVASAIYFSDRWGWEFNPALTREDVFYAPGGETAALYMYREGNNQHYYEDERVQAMPLDFRSGGRMYILLPRDGNATGLVRSMDHAYFEYIRENAESATGRLVLPKFRIETDVLQLKETLAALGVPLFDRQAAPLTGGLIEGDVPVYLSTAVHKAVVEVDESGATAAAVTAMIAVAGGAEPRPTSAFEMICDRPFVFILCDDTFDGGEQVLFVGVVKRPEAE